MPVSVMVLGLSRVCSGVAVTLGLFVPVIEILHLTTGLRHKKSSHCESPSITPHSVNLKGFE